MDKDKIDFDTIVNRKNTNSIKYDFTAERNMPEDILPLWVADMDFKAPKEVIDAIIKRVEHGIFGYSEAKDEYFQALRGWMEEKHNWQIEKEWVVKTPGVVFAIAMAVQAFTSPGDSVMIQQPVYYPFKSVIEDNGRNVVDNTLVLNDAGKYEMDLEDFERKVVEHQVKLFLLCSPHNPVGRVWTEEELIRLGDICVKHDVIVVSDEIHQDFVYTGRHHVFADINESFRERTITCTAPSKTFNLAGLQVSNIMIANPKLRKKFINQINAAGYSQLNVLGLTACEAAYRHGSRWHEQLIGYLKGNLIYLKEFLIEHLPQIKLIEPEGTYLVWLDFRGLNMTESQLEDLIVHKAGLWLDNGTMFGKAGEGFQRINITCQRSTLEKAMIQLRNAIKQI